MLEADAHPFARPVVDLLRPSVARVYDCLLGGTANWAIDREFCRRALAKFPLLKDITLANRNFLNRVVRHLSKLGIRQFLDIGAGVPTAGNTHQVADSVAPDSRVVYVDNEPVAVAQAEVLLDREGDPDRHAVINADLRDPDALWRDVLATGILNPNQPIALLMIAVLHLYQQGPDGADIGAQSAARLRELLPQGSYLGISHITDEGVPAELGHNLEHLKHLYDHSCTNRVIWRPRCEINALFGDFDLVAPGMVWTPEWRPEEADPRAQSVWFTAPNHSVIWAGVGRKPG